jgi:hypothetical protein
MSEENDLNRKRQRAFMVWIDPGLYAAVREKLYQQRKTGKELITTLLTIWSGYDPNERKDPGPGNPETGI